MKSELISKLAFNTIMSAIFALFLTAVISGSSFFEEVFSINISFLQLFLLISAFIFSAANFLGETNIKKELNFFWQTFLLPFKIAAILGLIVTIIGAFLFLVALISLPM